MAYDKNMNELKDYTFEIAKKCVEEGRDEFMFRYKEHIYSVGICNEAIMQMWNKLRIINKNNPEWFCYNDDQKKLLIVSTKENIMDCIEIEGKSLKNIWNQIVII